MVTPVLFLDDASRHCGAVDRAQAERTAMTLLDTLKSLRKINKKFALNTAKPLAQYQIADDWTLQSILGGASYKEEWDFIRNLIGRSPFATGLEEGLLEKVKSMEFKTRPGQALSSALAWASLMDSATVSFHAHADWSQAWVATDYFILEDDGGLREDQALVRNASQVAHAESHKDWLKLLGFAVAPTALQVWNERADRFPGLRFLQRMEKNFVALEGSGLPFLQAISALESLSKDVARWKPANPWPDFSTKTSPEAEHRKTLCWANDDATGVRELFDWHTRFTGGLEGRVHFRVDSKSRSIVVAYVGGKLLREIPS